MGRIEEDECGYGSERLKKWKGRVRDIGVCVRVCVCVCRVNTVREMVERTWVKRSKSYTHSPHLHTKHTICIPNTPSYTPQSNKFSVTLSCIIQIMSGNSPFKLYDISL